MKDLKDDRQERIIGFSRPQLLETAKFPNLSSHPLEKEKHDFMKFGINLIDTLNLEKEQVAGRPRCLYHDIIKCLLVMGYHGMSYRRASSDINELFENGLINHAPKRSTLNKYMNMEETKKLIGELVQYTALFFKDNEDTLIIDSTWLSKRMYTGGYRKVHDKKSSNLSKCRKMHFGILKNSHVITICMPTEGTVSDFKMFEPIVVGTIKNGFNITTLLADKGYAGKSSYFLCENLNIKNVFIDFKSNVTLRRAKSGAWRKQLTLFKEHPEIWKDTYRYRPVIEGVVSSIKIKQVNYLRSKKPIAMDCELLLKCLIHNLTIIGRFS